MTKGPGVSVLVPAFNDARFIDEALTSVAAQRYADFEVVVADDSSADATAELARAWCERDPRFRLVRNEINLGMAANWNRALAEARAPLVFKLDADDALAPEALGRLVRRFEEIPELRFAACATIECDERMVEVGCWSGNRAFVAAGLDPALDRVSPGWSWFDLSFDDAQLWHSSAILARRDDLLARGGWDETWRCSSDTDLILHLTATDRPVAHVGYAGARYRRRPGSVSARSEAEGWRRAEAVLVGARALAASGAKRARRRASLRRHWWRYWSNLQLLLADRAALSGASPEHREALLRVAASIAPPPLDIRLEGRLRGALWRLRRPSRPGAA
jgi:glycosyltransferase involved in cell wall biosynthesis